VIESEMARLSFAARDTGAWQRGTASRAADQISAGARARALLLRRPAGARKSPAWGARIEIRKRLRCRPSAESGVVRAFVHI